MKSGMQNRLYPDQARRCITARRLVSVSLGLASLLGLTACEQISDRKKFDQLSELSLPLSPLKREVTLNQEPVRALQSVRLTAEQSVRAEPGKTLFHGTRLSGKVPTLRNVALTASYHHNGTVSELSGAVRVMVSVQLGRVLSSEDVRLLVAFFKSLKGEVSRSAQSGVPIAAMEQAS